MISAAAHPASYVGSLLSYVRAVPLAKNICRGTLKNAGVSLESDTRRFNTMSIDTGTTQTQGDRLLPKARVQNFCAGFLTLWSISEAE